MLARFIGKFGKFRFFGRKLFQKYPKITKFRSRTKIFERTVQLRKTISMVGPKNLRRLQLGVRFYACLETSGG